MSTGFPDKRYRHGTQQLANLLDQVAHCDHCKGCLTNFAKGDGATLASKIADCPDCKGNYAGRASLAFQVAIIKRGNPIDLPLIVEAMQRLKISRPRFHSYGLASQLKENNAKKRVHRIIPSII